MGVNIRSTRVCISRVRGSEYPGYESVNIRGTSVNVRECEYPGYESVTIRGTSVNIRGTRV